MIRSMTGFGRGQIEGQGKNYTIEIKSVNHRYFDINIKMPRPFISLEDRIRKTIQQKISRGKIDVFITLNTYEKQDIEASFNKELADSYFQCLQEIKNRYEVRDDISVSLIARFPEVILLNQKEENIETVWQELSSALNIAMGTLVKMREIEGEKLRQDIIARAEYLNDIVGKVELRAPQVVLNYKEKLTQRIEELLKDCSIDENRIAMEVAIFSDKVNIEEEIVRLKSHIIQLKDTLTQTEPVGRKLDFIIQEMNREINTIGSKANDSELINFVLNMKNEVEKIREQVQNVE